MAGILKITDGTTEIILTSSARPATASGLHRATLDQGWSPQVAEYKQGGIWQDSPLSDNRTLATTQFQNVVESFQLNLREAVTSLYPTGTSNASAQDLMIRTLQEIRRLLEKAASYWTTSWQDTPVYLVAQAAYETNTRYAILYRGSVPEDTDPYFQLFEREGDPMMLGLNCIVERGHWTANIPGTGTCVEASARQLNWEYDEWSINTAVPTNQIYDIIELTSGRMLAADHAGAPEIWHTDDGGVTPWVGATTPPTSAPHSLLQTSNGDVYAGCTNEIWRSTDNGLIFVRQNAVFGPTLNQSLAELGSWLYLHQAVAIRRSNDNGVTWNLVYSTGAGGFNCIISANDGYLYAGGGSGLGDYVIYRSNNGTTWTQVYIKHYVAATVDVRCLADLSDGYLYAVGQQSIAPGPDDFHIIRSVNGIDWSTVATITGTDATMSDPESIILASDGNYYLIFGTGELWRSPDVFAWNQVFDIAVVGSFILIEYSGNSRVYAGSDSDIWWSPEGIWDVGRTATCDDEVFVSNKLARAQLTYIWVYDSTLATYTTRFPSTLPFALLPNPMVNGDIVYFGIESAVFDSGPFDNIILDIIRTASGTYTLTWDYSDGGAGWPALNVQDGTTSFMSPGVNSIHWVPPDETTAGGVWAAEAVNGVTAYWVRAVVGGVAGTPVGPTQGNRDIYTCNWARVDVDDSQAPGDIPALLRFKFRNRSDENEYEVSDELDLLENRVIVGLRSMSRGSNFTAYLNCADEQNPAGVLVTAGTGTAFGNEIRAPTGRSAVHTTQGNGLTNYDTALTITLSTTIANEYYGIYHAYLRAQLYEPSAAEQGDHDDVRVRLRIRSGSGGVSEVTKYRQFVGWDDWDAASAEEENFKDWQLLDFGQINIPVTGLLKSTELPDETAIVIEASSAASTNLRIDLYDLILMPVDEWAGDFVDNALEDDSGVGSGYLLDVDSLAYPKRNIRALVRTIDASEFMRSVYQPITNGPAILQSNADQRLWFLTARGIYQGDHDGGDAHAHLHDAFADFIDAGVQVGMTVVNVTDGSSGVITVVAATQITGPLTGGAGNVWDNGDVYYIICPHWKSEPWNCHSVQLTGNSRYLSMRGDR